ncbi:hypothetical protein [Nostocoides veronense]|uniref:ARB-07466-like C-terminal domain-containing protein n=1 Tax=Nostocoides veronense TaxID=330836 RepID=A0ABN2LS33_9MICO
MSSFSVAARRPVGLLRAPGALALSAATALSATGFGVAALTGAPSAATGAAAPAPSLAAVALAQAPERAQVGRASRATTRAAIPQAADLPAPVSLAARAGVTAYTVTAVAKPKPKPVVVAPATTSATSASTSAPASSGASSAPSAGGSTSTYSGAGAALGLGPAASAVYSAIRSTFGITNIGGYRPGGDDHGSGRAVDVMISSSGQGDAVAAYAIANMGRLGISYVIWRQRIWLAGSGGWRAMEDRGSITANHYDHVHISVH